jgi:hypothetical protein
VERALDEAQAKRLVAYDIMTERYEIPSILQGELVDDADVFGKLIAGSDSEPGISAKSVHHLMKVVAGVPLRRPAWFFDVAETGDGLADVGCGPEILAPLRHLLFFALWRRSAVEDAQTANGSHGQKGTHWRSRRGESRIAASLNIRQDQTRFWLRTRASVTLRSRR